jgi:hypothetical protein
VEKAGASPFERIDPVEGRPVGLCEDVLGRRRADARGDDARQKPVPGPVVKDAEALAISLLDSFQEPLVIVVHPFPHSL